MFNYYRQIKVIPGKALSSSGEGNQEKTFQLSSPFGMVMPGRQFQSASGYRYGFNGMEKDDEVKGVGNHVDFGARGLDTRLGRWWSVDPKSKAHESVYAAFANNPILYVDPDGRDTLVMHKRNLETQYNTRVSLITFSLISKGVETNLPMIMYAGAAAPPYVQIENGDKVENFKLSYDRTMTHHPEWKNISIFVDKPNKNIFFHPGSKPGINNTGCLALSECAPEDRADLGVDRFFKATELALRKVRKMYEDFESDLTGDKFILKTNSKAPAMEKMSRRELNEIPQSNSSEDAE